MAEVIQSLRARLDGTQAQLSIEPLGKTWGHRSLLMLVLRNLVSNAVKFVPPERRPMVRVCARHEATTVSVSVADNGVGIAPERLSELGSPFRRLHSRRKFEGTGLGLAICKRIIEQHGGTLAIDSTPGEGSCFTLHLPERVNSGADRVAPPQAG